MRWALWAVARHRVSGTQQASGIAQNQENSAEIQGIDIDTEQSY
jgi:hypothetical protein